MLARESRTRLRGLLAVLGALAALGGIPVLLVVTWGLPFPDEFPRLNDVWEGLSRPDDGSLFVTVLGYAAWIGWAWFAVGFVAEVRVAVSHADLRPIRPGTPRWIARSLVAGIALAVAPVAPLSAWAEEALVNPPVAVEATSFGPSQSAAGPMVDELAGNRGPMPASRSGTEVSQPYRVKQGDSLWGIAEKKLQDPHRFEEIYDASDELEQPDGRRLSDPSVML